MTKLTAGAQQVIAHEGLGSPLQTYSPQTGLKIFVGILLVGVATFIAWLLLSVVLAGESDLAIKLVLFFILIWSGASGLVMVFATFSNRKKRAVICTLGVALLTPAGAESFRWEDVLTTTRRVESHAESGASLDSYTVHCHDGRKIVFDGFAHLEDLAEAIDVQAARTRYSS